MNTHLPAAHLFDDWPERYDAWFTTPAGRLIFAYELELICDLLHPGENDCILDAGCGTGIFTREFLMRGAKITGLDISLPMLARARQNLMGYPFTAIDGDMLQLPFADAAFDKAVSVTAIEFIGDARAAVSELFRVVRPGGYIVVASLNSLSPWAARRKNEAGSKKGSIFQEAIFRSPTDMRRLAPVTGITRTAIHFQKDDDPETMRKLERQGRLHERRTGAFIATCWQKPA